MEERFVTINVDGLDVELRCAICENPMRTDRGCDGGCIFSKKKYSDIISVINGRIKKGKWIRKEKIYPDLPNDSDYRFECSLCGWSDIHNEKMIVPYCWHCGAYVRGEEE